MSTNGKQKNKQVEILIAEDSPTQAEQLKYLLEKHNFLVSVANDGEEALALLRQHKPAIVISDIVMPRMDGYELCRQIKADEKLKNIPVVLLTALSDPKDVMSGLECGADNFVTKPYNEDYLLNRIQYLLTNDRLEETTRVQVGIEIIFAGRKYFITSSRLQVLNLLLSTYETAVQKNNELIRMQDELRELNEQLEQRVKERTTELAKANEELKAEMAERKQAEELYQALAKSSPVGIYILQDGRFRFVNPQFLKYSGYSEDELLDMSPLQLVHPEDRERARANLLQMLKGNLLSPCEFRVINKDGDINWAMETVTSIQYNGERAALGNFMEITERKRAEEAIRESEERYRTLFESAAEGILIADIETKELKYANPAICTMLGYSQEELTKMGVGDIHPKISLEHVLAEFAAQARGEELLSTLPCLKKDGTIIYADINATKANIDGRECNIGFFSDITERKKTEEALRESEEKLRLMFESLTMGVTVFDLNGEIVQLNEASARMRGYSREELIGRSIFELVAEKDRVRVRDNLKRRLEDGYRGKSEYTLFRKDGSEFPVEASNAVLRDACGNPTGFITILEDITEQKKMQEQLILTDRLASIGQLASGIAHELNNPLTGVIGFSDLLLEKDLPEDVKEDLVTINREAKRTANIVKGLLTFARKQRAEKEPVDINNVIQGVLQLRSYEQRVSNIKVNSRFAPEVPQVMGNGGQLQQVFINIIVNAEQAMLDAHGRGALTITTERVGDIVRASFADDGPGISPENTRRLFTPFFTTKEVGIGTGLGLSICHGIITEHSGRIYAESELGKGATFIVELPIIR